MYIYSNEGKQDDARLNNFQHEVPAVINNNDLVSNEFLIFQKSVQIHQNKQDFKENKFTRKLLKEGLRLNFYYTIIGYGIFS